LRNATVALALLACAVFLGSAWPAGAEAVTWQPLYEPGSGGWITSFSVSPHEPRRCVIGGDMLGIAWSDYRGELWHPSFGLATWEVCDFTWHPTDPCTVWAGTFCGPALSTDRGKTWTIRRKGFPEISGGRYREVIEKVLFDPGNTHRLIAIGGNSSEWRNNGAETGLGAIYESLDDGQSWTLLTRIGPDGAPAEKSKGGGNILSAAFAAGSSITLYTDGNWQRLLDEHYTHDDDADPNRLALITSDDPYHDVCSASGVWVSADDGRNWSQANDGLAMTRGNCITFSPHDGEQLVCGTWGSGYYLGRWPRTCRPAGTRSYTMTDKDKKLAESPTDAAAGDKETTMKASTMAAAVFVVAVTAGVSGNVPAADTTPSITGQDKQEKEDQQKGEEPKDARVQDTLKEIFAAAATSWSAKNFAAVRAQCGKALAMSNAPSHYRSYAHLRIAQSYMAEKDTAAAKAEYEKIKANTAYPEVHRYEAGECIREIERTAKGLPGRDVTASRTKIPPITKFTVEYFVAPDGNDANPGTKEKPFASLEAARDAIRALKAKGELPGPVCVRLMPGEYQLKGTFELTAADSGTTNAPIIYRADKKGAAVLYGGTRLSGFTPVTDPAVIKRLPDEAKGKVFQCDLKELGIKDYSALTERGYGVKPPPSTLELFFNGKPLTLARWPNSGFVNGGNVIEPGSKQAGKPSVFEYLDDRHSRWTTAGDGWLFGYFRHGWADRALKIKSIDTASKRVTCGPYELLGENMEPVKWFNKGKIRYFAFNLLEELDMPGEWYLDRETGILYFYPPSDPAKATVETGMLTVPMVSMANVSNVRIEGLVFDLSRANGLLIKNSEHCLIAGCTVKRFAGNGITITGGRENGILGCDLYSLGRRATEVIGGDRKTLTPAAHFVENCWMHSFGRLDHTYVPAVQLEGCGNRVAHNLFGDCPSSVVRIEGNDHFLEYNRVYRALLETEDQGAMELFGNPTYRGVVFRYNQFSDIGFGFEGGPAGRAGIRLDDAISGMVIYGNIFYRAAQGFGGININGGRDNIIDNNIFAECEKGITGGYNAKNKVWGRMAAGENPNAFIRSELYLSRYPVLRHVLEQPGLSSAWRNVFWKCGPLFSTYGKPSIDKFDVMANAEHATDDPGFVDAARGDFRLRPDAPLFARTGFRPIPVEEIGLYNDEYRATWPVGTTPMAAPGGESGSADARDGQSVALQSEPADTKGRAFTLAERNGRVCLLRPEGKPFMMLGISHVGGAFKGAELRELSSSERNARLTQIEKELRGWHLNTVPQPEFWDRFPFIVPSDRMVGEAWLPENDPGSRFEDVFDPAFRARLRKQVAALCAKTRDNPNCIGYWWSDIPPWNLAYAKSKYGKHWVDFIRDLPDTAPGKKRYAEFLKAPGPHEDRAFLRLIARELYAESAAAYKEHDPKRLIFGERYNGFGTPTEVLEEAAKVVDVISVQPYEGTFGAEKFEALHRLTKKPILISDWNLSFKTEAHAVTMWPQFPTQAAAAAAYEKYLRDAFAKPYILGYFKCQYVDQVLPTGMLKQGLLQTDGKPYEEFAGLLKVIHERLIEQFVNEGRMAR
jgi:hypothetical protein